MIAIIKSEKELKKLRNHWLCEGMYDYANAIIKDPKLIEYSENQIPIGNLMQYDNYDWHPDTFLVANNLQELFNDIVILSSKLKERLKNEISNA